MMKKILLNIGLLAFIVVQLSAQNNMGKADDSQRIAITPQVSDQQIPQGAKNMLINKMKQICAKNGLAGDEGNPFFVMDATVDILSKELTPTAPPMHALNMSINFFIKDATGNVYSQTSFNAKGVGQNETKAYMEGIKRVNVNSGQFKAMVDQGKEKVLEFYNSQCDFIISKATALQKQGNNREAIKVLKSVPPISKECYDKCMEILSTIEDAGEPEPVSKAGGADSNVGSYKVEIDDQIFLVYKNAKVFGNKMTLYFEFENLGNSDYELSDYAYDTRIIDENGAEHKVEQITAGGKSHSTTQATIIPGVPVKMECLFPKVNKVNMFEYNYKDKVFRLKDIAIGALAGNNADAQAVPGSANESALQAAVVSVGSKVFVEVEKENRIERKIYSPGKIKTIASEATKNEYEVMAIGECSSDVIWTKDIITQWHQATKTNVSEGMLIIYASGDISETRCFAYGKVIAVDELYKNLITIKGRWGDIVKITPERVLIVDKSVVIK